MKFAIYQIQITKADRDMINETGDFNSVPAFAAKTKMQFADDLIGGLASDAMDNGFYTHVANIEATDFNDVFEVGNIGPESSIERLGRMSSLSVGDVIVGEDGQVVVVADCGFVAFSFNPKLAA